MRAFRFFLTLLVVLANWGLLASEYNFNNPKPLVINKKRKATTTLTEATLIDEPTKKFKIAISENSPVVEDALLGLSTLTGESTEYSYNLHNEHAFAFAFATIKAHDQISFLVPLIEELLLQIQNQDFEFSHIAIRVDPDTSCMFAKKKNSGNNRRFTHDWHTHIGSDRFIFVLSHSDHVATQIQIDVQELFIPLCRLFFLPGWELHRTPPQTKEKCTRVQFSISVNKKSPT